MTREEFNKLLDELDDNSVETLKKKNEKYSLGGDPIHNFTSGADIMGDTPAKTCWGYMTKHLVALRDMVDRDDFSDREDFLEKCQDTINYIRFLWVLGNEKLTNDFEVDNEVEKFMNSKPTKFWDECCYFDSIEEANHVLDEMKDMIKRYGFVSIADYYDLTGAKGDYSEEKVLFRGWKNLDKAVIMPVLDKLSSIYGSAYLYLPELERFDLNFKDAMMVLDRKENN